MLAISIVQRKKDNGKFYSIEHISFSLTKIIIYKEYLQPSLNPTGKKPPQKKTQINTSTIFQKGVHNVRAATKLGHHLMRATFKSK